MWRKWTVLLLALALCLLCMPAAVQTRAEEADLEDMEQFLNDLTQMTADYASAEGTGTYATARILVKCAGKLDGCGAVDRLLWDDWHILQYETPAQAEAAANYYKAQGYAVDADYPVFACGTVEESPYNTWGFSEEYVNIQALQQRVLDQVGGDVSRLPEILVGVVDSGLDADHALLEDRVVAGYNLVNKNENTADSTYHGTHVAGTIAEGTLSNVKIMPIKVLDSKGQGYYATFAMGMRYAVEHGCRVVNLSIGGASEYAYEGDMELFEEVVQEGRAKGVIFCVAACNYSDNADLYCPANVAGVITVAAHDISRQLGFNSNYGSCVDITAPGVSVLSTYSNGTVENMSGTSMATPHVTAVCALILSYDNSLNSDQVLQLLQDNAAPSDIVGGGAGLLCATNIFAENAADLTVQQPSLAWNFEADQPENDRWGEQEGWQIAVKGGNVSLLQGLATLYSDGTGTPLLSPEFVAGDTLRFALRAWHYGAQAGEMTVSVSEDGGKSFTEPIATFAITEKLQLCTVDLTAYSGKQICIRLQQQGHEEGATVLLDAVQVYGGSRGQVTVSFVSEVTGELIGTVQIPAGGLMAEADFPAPADHAGYHFYGWDHADGCVYQAITVTAQYSLLAVDGWDFETDPLTRDWTSRLDGDGAGNSWLWYQGTAFVIPQGQGMMNSGAAIVQRPDRWLISPVFAAGEQLRFQLVAPDGKAGGTVSLHISLDNGATWTLLAEYTAAAEVQTLSVDTAAYAGQNVQIAFCHTGQAGQGAVGIDDIQILGRPVEDSATPEQPKSDGDTGLWAGILGSAAVLAAAAAATAVVVHKKKKSQK